MCRDHLLSITLGGGEDFLLGGGVTWGCYMGVLHGFQGEQRGGSTVAKRA